MQNREVGLAIGWVAPDEEIDQGYYDPKKWPRFHDDYTVDDLLAWLRERDPHHPPSIYPVWDYTEPGMVHGDGWAASNEHEPGLYWEFGKTVLEALEKAVLAVSS